MLSVVLASLAQATKAAASVFAVLALILYVFALFLTQSLGKEDTGLYPGFASEWATDMESPSWQMLIGDFNPYMYFGSIPSSMYTLFNMACFAEWQEVVRPIAVKQPEFVPVFMFFALVVGFGFMNVLIAVMVDAVMAESQKMDKEQKTIQREQQVKLLEKIEEMLTRVDTNGDGTIGLAELNQLMHESNKLQELLKDIDFPRGWSSSEMLSMLDSNGYGLIDVSKFSKSLFRLLYGSNFQQMCIMQASINRVKAMLVEQNEFSIKMFNILQDDMAATKGVETAGVRQASQSQPGENNEAQHDIPIAFGFGHQSAVQLKPQEFAGSTSDTGHKSNIENDLILRLQMTVKECIHQEFALSKPSRSNPSPGISVLEQDRGIFDCLQVVPRLQNVPTEAEWRAIAAESEAQQLQADLKECMRRMENLLDQVLVRIAEDARSSVQERASPVPPREDNTQSAKERTREAFGAHGEVLCQRSNTDKEFMEFDSKVQESQARPAQIETEGMSSSSQHWQVEVGVQSNKASI